MGARTFRLLATGTAVTLLIVATATVGVIRVVAASDGAPSSYVSITPCRLFDTRSGSDNVGERESALGEGETATFTVWGSNGNCLIPTSATGITANLTVVEPTRNSYVTLWPADVSRPLVSSINFTAGQAPTANGTNVKLSSDGKIKAFNLNGNVNVIVDISGYHETASGSTTQDPNEPITIDVGLGPAGVAVGAGNVWIANQSSGTITRLDASSGMTSAVVKLGASSAPSAVLFDGSNVWAAGDGNVWKIDSTTNEIRSQVPIASQAHALAFDGDSVWTVSGSQLTRVDSGTATIELNLPFDFAASVASAESAIWVGEYWGTSLIRVEPSTGEIERFDIGRSQITSIVPVGSSLWITHNSNIVTVFDTVTKTATYSFGLGGNPRASTFDGSHQWFALQGSNAVVMADPATGEVIDTVNTGMEPGGVAFDGQFLWVTSFKSNTVTKIKLN